MNTVCKNLSGGRPGLAVIAAAALVGGAFSARASLEDYDAAITADAAGGLTPVTTLTTPVTLTGTAGSAFNFGATSGDASIEFILEGDPTFNNTAFLAVGATTASSLRYELWDNTGQLGFTQSRVADYSFTPAVSSPSKPAHVVYVWDPTATTMKVYVEGQLAGTTTGVDPAFVMPSGQGWLGAAADGSELMKGKISRVTVYDSVLTEAAIARHAKAFGGLVDQALSAYDAAVAADAAGGLTPLAKLTSPMTFDGTGGKEFDFGPTFGDTSIEFILEGDISANVSAYLAVGENSTSNLRYELWNNTGQLGFTQLGVADYGFTPGVPSPGQPTHIVYAYDTLTFTMKVYVNGALAGTAANVDANFAMPTGPGWLGANPGGAEPMVGTVYRVSVYSGVLGEAVIRRHAQAFTDILRPPIIGSYTAAKTSIAAGDYTMLTWSVQNAKSVSINGVDQGSVTYLEVTPAVSTTYTLKAVNSFGSVSSTVRVVVNPKLDAYDAAITADATGALTPLAKLTSTAVLNGSAGVPFNFGATSGDTTIEFVLEGDTTANNSAFLAVGENSTSSLRYELWDNTAQLGFTQGGVADYQFTPYVPSPSWPTHVAYQWNAAEMTMKIYVNGTLAGTTKEVSDSFGAPTGQGWLGANPTGGEVMRGAIFRVTVYNGLVAEATLGRHAKAFLSDARPLLDAYDAAVLVGPTPTARLLAPIALSGVGGVPFDFGATSGDATLEFVLEGDPSWGVSANLAAGTNTASLIRYEVWDNTSELGFTQIRVADYQFSPGLAAPTVITHIAMVYDPATATMKAFKNGAPAGTVTGVDANFGMPVGPGMLGANLDGTEPMLGTIHRVNVYDSALADDVVARHAKAFVPVSQAPKVSVALQSEHRVQLTLSEGISGSHYRLEYADSLGATTQWQLLFDVPALSGTLISVTDPTPLDGKAHRFYRAVQLP